MSVYKHKKITIDYAKERIQYWEQALLALEKYTYSQSDSVPTKIFKLYANLQSVTKVAAALKLDGIINQIST
ncbi:hypothetical protein D7V86_22430 [bacterium D16-51]|nr:hypothetical protein D7V96_24330 [bacterium D16-59]RKI54978.1 hypothetical protein D7V86_22430 [bacterium D16-51]